MITPTYVSFEQAKLLKEKGFKYYCKVSYWDNELTCHTPGFALENGETSQENYYDFPRFYAPEQHQVVEWLLQKYNIWVTVDNLIGNYFYFSIRNTQSKDYASRKGCREKGYDTPQEAYSAAFDYILNKLI
jgi:hypothetical protein